MQRGKNIAMSNSRVLEKDKDVQSDNTCEVSDITYQDADTNQQPTIVLSLLVFFSIFQ